MVPLLGAALVLVSLLGFLAAYRASTHRLPVLILAHALRAGAPIRVADLTTAEIAADPRLRAVLVPERMLPDLLGQHLIGSLPAGTPLTWALFTSAQSRRSLPAVLSLVVPLLHALAGALRAGDRIGVFASEHTQTATPSTQLIADNLPVVAVSSPAAGSDPASATVAVVVAVPDQQVASRLAFANQTAGLDILRDPQPARR